MYLHKKTHISAALKKTFMAFVMAVVLSGCVYDSYPPDAPQEDKPASVFLTLSVATADAAEPSATRADSYYFEDAQTPYEKINHLRVIICDNAGTVKYNRKVTYLANGSIKDDNLTFEVDPGKYSIHLFANERSLPEEIRQYFYDAIPGAIYPSAELDAVELTRENGNPIFGLDQYLPMTESFDITVEKPTKEMERYRTEKLFVTRVPVKFTFALKQEVESLSVRIYNISRSEYLLPNNLEYFPAKNQYAEGNKRIITKYSTPDETEPPVFETKFSNLEMKKGYYGDGTPTDEVYYVTTPIYLCETPVPEGGKYRISICLDEDDAFPELSDEDKGWTPVVDLENLPSLPRNTHVVVRMDYKNALLQCQVDVLPYTGVVLDPGFGIPTTK